MRYLYPDMILLQTKIMIKTRAKQITKFLWAGEKELWEFSKMNHHRVSTPFWADGRFVQNANENGLFCSCIFYEILQFVRGLLTLSEQSQFSIIKGGRTWLILRIKIGCWTLFSRKFLSPQFSLLHYPDQWQRAAGPVLRPGQGGGHQQEEHRHRHLRLRGPRGQGLLRLRETQLRDKQQLWWELRRHFSWHWPQHPPDGGDTAED